MKLSKGNCLDQSNRSKWPTYITFGLGRVIIISAFGVGFSIAQRDRGGGTVDDHDGVRRRAFRLLRQLLRRKISPRYRTHHM